MGNSWDRSQSRLSPSARFDTVVRVIPPERAGRPFLEQLEWARAMLAQAGFAVTALLRSGQVEDVLCAYRTEHAIDLIVMGAYGHSKIREFLVGSTTTRSARRRSPCCCCVDPPVRPRLIHRVAARRVENTACLVPSCPII
ncbi:universal stress protein [Thiobacillus sp.]|uniref:universal stress protein n=1 Tax=Thiobacillus sp. TaxID=924 RepID=UPI003526A6FF